MDKFHLQKLRDLPIEGVAERLGLRVERHKCLCPFHDDHTPSLSFKNNKFKCWSCGESGDSISLAEKVLGLPFLDACRWLGLTPDPSPRERGEKRSSPSGEVRRGLFDASRYERFFEHPFLSEAARRFLFEERKLDERVVRWCRLTSWRDKQGINWLQIPYYNREGKLVGVQNRRLGTGFKIQDSGFKIQDSGFKFQDSGFKFQDSGFKIQDSGFKFQDSGFKIQDSGDLKPETCNLKPSAPRFRFPQGSECGIYNLPVLGLLKQGEPLYIAEGCSDCWALLSAGHKSIAIPSATLLTNDVRGKMEEVRGQFNIQFHMWPDNDTPGERLFLQLKELLPNLQHHQLPLGCKDFSDYYVQMKTPSKS